jgi:hypothetical protein
VDAIGLLTHFLDTGRGLTGTVVLGIHRLHVLGYDFILTLLTIEEGRVVGTRLLGATRMVVARLGMQCVLV